MSHCWARVSFQEKGKVIHPNAGRVQVGRDNAVASNLTKKTIGCIKSRCDLFLLRCIDVVAASRMMFS